jgi:hypothetical protein
MGNWREYWLSITAALLSAIGTLGERERMVGAMDLGGGSTQITFVTTSNSDVSRVAVPWCSSIEQTACVNLAFIDMIQVKHLQ